MTHKHALAMALLLTGILPATILRAEDQLEASSDGKSQTADGKGQDQPEWHLKASNPQGWAEYDWVNRIAHGTNGVIFTYSGAFVVADSMKVNEDSGELFADGAVRIQ